MDPISYGVAAKQKQRIEKVIAEPDSTSGIVTVPQVIATGETITIPAGRTVVHPNLQVDGTLDVQGTLFVPAGGSVTQSLVDATVVKQNGSVVANDSAVVHKTGDETKAGVLTLSDGLKLQGQNVTPFSGFKNYIINGNFDIWQRGTSQTCTSAAFQYGSVDRFCLINIEATNYTISRVSVDGTEPFSAKYFVRNVVPLNTTSGIVFDQHIENLKRFSNKTITLSMWVKGDAGKKIGFGYQASYGTGGTPSASNNILGKIFILTGSWQKVVMTAILPDVVIGKTYGTNDDSFLRLSIAFSSGSTTYVPEIFFQSGTFDIAQVQLEEGSVATPFENRPYGLELSLCQRYYESSYSNDVTVGSASTLGAKFTITIGSGTAQGFTFIEPKRVPPTVAIYSPSGTAGYVWNVADIDNGSAIPRNIGTKGVRYLNNDINNWTANSGITYHYTASAEL